MNPVQQQIVEAFARHVDRVGYAKATLDDVARELRISKKTIYVHFEGKREIYERIVTQRAEQERLRMKAAIAQFPSARERAAALLRYSLLMARAHIEETSKMEWMQEFEVASEAFRRAQGELLRETVEEGIASGELAAGDAALVERMVGAMVLEYLVHVNANPAYDRDDELVERIVRFIG